MTVHQITESIGVTVETFYQPAQSNPLTSDYLFAYRITIENLGVHPVKLLRRHWHILDSNGGPEREVEGEGVVGVQPIIQPHESYQYVSACSLRSDMGKMYGTYRFENLYHLKQFTVHIPEFEMIAPFKMN